MYKHKKSGFIVYIVITMLLCIILFALSLNMFKSGAVMQLSRTIDQNRLTLLASSANAEVMAIIHSNANSNPTSAIYKALRRPFALYGESEKNIKPQTIPLLSDFVPKATANMARDSGYKLRLKSSASLTVYRRSVYNSMRAYNGTLEIVSSAALEGQGKALIEVKEQREVRLLDLCHTLDKYVLFLKNYCADLNDPRHKLKITGISSNNPGHVSRVYLGTANYPNAAEEGGDKIYMDLCFNKHSSLRGVKNLFGSQSQPSFKLPSIAGADHPNFKGLLFADEQKFSNLKIPLDKFCDIEQVKSEYERVIDSAAIPLAKKVGVDTAGQNRQAYCQQILQKADNYTESMVYEMLKDFVDNSNGRDYRRCAQFQVLINWCANEWVYRYGYTDAASIWHVSEQAADNSEGRTPRAINNLPRYAGVASVSASFFSDHGPYGPYMSEYRHASYNPERAKVGIAQDFYGEDDEYNQIPVLVEGKAYLRFFKMAYLDEFQSPVDFAAGRINVWIRVIPSIFRCAKWDTSYLNSPIACELSSCGYFSDRFMKSGSIDSLSFNALWGQAIKCFNKNNAIEEYNPYSLNAVIENPFNSTHKAKEYGRLIDFKNTTWNYKHASDFLKNRLSEDGKRMFIDGPIYIQQGDLDLTGVEEYFGRGLIYLANGNCILSSLLKQEDKVNQSSLRIYLRRGDFVIKHEGSVIIEASLGALYDLPGSNSLQAQGNIIFNKCSDVHIIGNLLLDSLMLNTKDNTGLADGGCLHITHDEDIYSPQDTEGQVGAYHVSIGPIKTMYSIKSGAVNNG